ncbi:MAG: hypothetical protein DRI90_14550, partial [Deltaproteobacteria bacterium]
MKRLSHQRLVGAAVIGLVLGGLGLQNLLARQGYEMALAAGLLCPSVAALVTAGELGRRALGGLAMLRRALETGVALALVAYGVAFSHGLFAGFCDLRAGTVLFVLGPGVGTVLGSVWGTVAAELPPQLGMQRSRKRSAVSVLVAVGGPLGSILVNLALIYGSPVIFAYDPFAGYFSGALYDTVLTTEGMWSYRAASAATLLSCWVAAWHLERNGEGRLRFVSRRRPGVLACGALAAAASIGTVALGDRLGHWQTASSIAAELGGETIVGSCQVRHDRRIPQEDVRRFAADCAAHVATIRQWLGRGSDEPVMVYLFHN